MMKEKFYVAGYKGTLTCPKNIDIYAFENNNTICNEMFDCIEKHVEPDSNSYIYNIIKSKNSLKFLKKFI